MSDFVVDTTVIKKLVVDQKTTYTFLVRAKDIREKSFFNMTMFFRDGQWQTAIMELRPTPTNWEELRTGTKLNFEGAIKVVYRTDWWISNIYTDANGCSVFASATGHCPGGGVCSSVCDGCTESCVTVTLWTVCAEDFDMFIAPAPSPGPGGGGGGGAVINDPSGYVFESVNLTSENFADFVRAEHAAEYWNSLTEGQQIYANTEIGRSTYPGILENLLNNYDDPQVLAFTNWAINYLSQNFTVTWEVFQNQFMTPREGPDGNYDAAFWENPNLSFPPQTLPSWSDFESAYPDSGEMGADLVNSIGGPVKDAYDNYPTLGYCAVKVSYALNYSGVIIPNIVTSNGNLGTVLGGDGKYYFLNAKALNKWMRETFGTNPETTNTHYNEKHHHIDGIEVGTNGENIPILISGLKGIYSMVSTTPSWASGHADLLNDDGTCVFGCHFYDNPPAPIDYIDIWVLE